ncbi:MAG TPA: TonB-dependent receptor [Bryobacteraceae bacterium]|nr:TonB-dependent receptor [Bryobacteraceae bacterium]
MGKQATLTVLTLTIFAALSFGQSAAINGQIEGTITDPTGAALSSAAVRIENIGTGFKRSQQTDAAGFYRFPVLPLGEYTVTVESSGFAATKRTGITLSAGSAATVDITLQVLGVASTVEVSAAAPVSDPSRTDIGSTLSGNQVLNLPLVSRNPYNFILLQPNVSGRGNQEFGVPRKLNANGFNGRVNYQLDGNANTQSDRAGIRLIPISNTFVAEVQNVNNGFAPEFGNTVGAVFNTITKSGSNDLHGEAGYIFRRTDFVARPALLNPSRPKPEQSVDSFFANAGAPIIHDKAFLFAAFEKVKRDLPNVVTVNPAVIAQLGLPERYANAIPFGQNLYFGLIKADFQINDSNRLTVRYNLHRNDSPYNNGGALVVESQTYNFVDRSHTFASQLISTLGSSAVNEIRFQVPYRTQQQLGFAANVPGPSITIPGQIQFGNSPQLGFDFRERSPELSENYSYTRSEHTYKVGGVVRNIRDLQSQVTSAVYTFPTVQSYLDAARGVSLKGYSAYNQAFGNQAISYNSIFWSGYAQDNWKVRPNITLTYGLRYELYDVPNPDKNATFAYSRDFRVDKNNFAPRVGLAIGLGKDHKTVLRASGGIFYDPPQTDIYRRALLNSGNPSFFTISASPSDAYAPAFPAIFTAAPAGFAPAVGVESVSPDFATLYSSNANVTVTRALTNDLGVSVSYLFTRGNRLPVYRNINVVPNGTLLADGRPVFGSGRVYPAYRNVSVAESVGQSVYNGGNVTLNKRLSHGLEMFASYTYSKSIDDAPEQNNIDSGTAVYPSDPTNRRRDRGVSLTDHTHVFITNAVYTPAARIESPFLRHLINDNRISLIFNASSGDVFNYGSNRANLNGDPTVAAAQQRPAYIGRNTLRSPAVQQLDARYSRIFPVGERLRPEFFAEFTNLLNHTNVTNMNVTGTVDAQGLLLTPASLAWTDAREQRLIQFGVKLNF